MTTLDKAPVETRSFGRRQEKGHLVWDWPLRIFHWSLVFCLVGAFVTNRLGVAYFRYHVWFGYAIIVLVCFRIVWGFVGTRHARFANFLRGPGRTLRYLSLTARGHSIKSTGHNPAGAWMVVFLLAIVLGQAILGLFGNDEIMNSGPLAGFVGKAASLLSTSLHRKLFYVIVAAAAVHILAVAFYEFCKGQKIVAAMISGRKPQGVAEPHDAIHSSHGFRAFVICIVLIGVLALLIAAAPSPDIDIASY